MNNDWSVSENTFDLCLVTKAPVSFLDEKLMHMTNRQQNLKRVPEVINALSPKIRAKRCPVKVPRLGVVACPHCECDFDGHVLLTHTSEEDALKQASKNNEFSGMFWQMRQTCLVGLVH